MTVDDNDDDDDDDLDNHRPMRLYYTMNHKKRDILFLTITLVNLNRFF